MTDTPTEAPTDKYRQPRRVVYYLSLIVLIAATAAMTVLAMTLWVNLRRWDPLGDYPLQVIATPTIQIVDPEYRLSTSALPTIYLDGTVKTSGVKCVKEEDGTVNVKGILSWVSDRPPGRILEVGRGGGKRGPGCVNYEFDNAIPPEVTAEIRRLSAEGIHESDWHLTGTETPVKADGTQGEPRTWVSTSVRIIDQPTPPGAAK